MDDWKTTFFLGGGLFSGGRVYLLQSIILVFSRFWVRVDTSTTTQTLVNPMLILKQDSGFQTLEWPSHKRSKKKHGDYLTMLTRAHITT